MVSTRLMKEYGQLLEEAEEDFEKTPDELAAELVRLEEAAARLDHGAPDNQPF